MHHAYEAKSSFPKTWDQHSNIVLGVDVFFHETKHGLLTCGQNNTAVTMIQNKMAEYSTLKRDTSRFGERSESYWNSLGNFQQTSQKKYAEDTNSKRKDQSWSWWKR